MQPVEEPHTEMIAFGCTVHLADMGEATVRQAHLVRGDEIFGMEQDEIQCFSFQVRGFRVRAARAATWRALPIQSLSSSISSSTSSGSSK
jgi:hypothetical protein